MGAIRKPYPVTHFLIPCSLSEKSKTGGRYRFAMPAVETIAELVQVALDMLVGQPMKRPSDESLGIGDNGMSPVHTETQVTPF